MALEPNIEYNMYILIINPS